jgi:biopolymer transport protein ExbD
MNFGRRENDEVSLNLIPLIDVVFFLLIFFVLSASFTQTQRLKVDLPKAKQGETVKEQAKDWMIEIDAQGHYALNGEAVALEDLTARLQALPEHTPDTVVLIRADAHSEHQAVILALDAARAAGLLHISLATESSGKPSGE